MRTRKLSLDICNYDKQVICPLYDNQSDVSGQAYDVFVTYERNGWKELTFSIPSVCSSENGEEENFRLQYLIADYRIRLIDDYETDWYLISEPKITHDAFSKTVEVRAAHVSQLLNFKNLDLEFSDDEGNNEGTAEQLLTAVLDGTGWSVGEVDIFEDFDGNEKIRALDAPAQTGAFKMIQSLCDTFEAKAIFHGDKKIVDLIHMNPFSVDENDLYPKKVKDYNVLELYYDKNIHSFSKTANADNIVTKLYAYGSYGDQATGICELKTCKHIEYILSGSAEKGSEVSFYADGVCRFFICTDDIQPSDKLIWSLLDFQSRLYVWNETTEKAYHVYNTNKTTSNNIFSTEEIELQNYVPALLNFTYYDKVGLLTEDMFQFIAKYQRKVPAYYQTSIHASEAFGNELTILSQIGESNSGFLRLNVSNYRYEDGALKLIINTSESEGVIYRSDYLEARKNYFQWYVASAMKDNGLPVTGIGSVVYIIHTDTSPITWEKFYVKAIEDQNGNYYHDSEGNYGNFSYKLDEGVPSALLLWGDYSLVPPIVKDTDRFFLYCTDSMTGSLGGLTVSNEIDITDSTTEGSIKHLLKFVDDRKEDLPCDYAETNYGWMYKQHMTSIQTGELYICWGEKGEQNWNRVYIQEETPEVVNGAYFLNRKTSKFYHGELNKWVLLDKTVEERTARNTMVVYKYALEKDKILHGEYEKIHYNVQDNLSAGNYAFPTDYDYYYIFTTDMNLLSGTDLWIDTVKQYVYQTNDIGNIVSSAHVPCDSITYQSENIIKEFIQGDIDENGTYINSNNKYISNYISVYEQQAYECSSIEWVAFYTSTKKFIRVAQIDNNKIFTTNDNERYVRIITENPDNMILHIQDYDNKIYLDGKVYTVLRPTTQDGELRGINSLMKKYVETADRAFLDYYKNMTDAQNATDEYDQELVDILGDLLREGRWQDSKYVKDDEPKLYKDAMDNLEKLGQPEYTYEFTFLDLYGTDHDGYAVDEDESRWPDIQITDAIHLVDPDIDTNKWAYIDKLNKCYDQPWKTTLEVNTQLSLINQHEFTDVLSRIAEVANETKNRQEIYKRAAALSNMGTLTANQLEGAIQAGRNQILGGGACWYTDDRGRMIFESSDGKSAMMLSGDGWMISSGKNSDGDWNWRNMATGYGLTADNIYTGSLSATLIEAGTITADKLNAAVGQELEIGSNKALMIYATEDGFRPAGGVLTPTVNTGDSYIEIAAKDGSNPAYINIASGGTINIQAGSTQNTSGTENVTGTLNLKSTGKLNLESGSDMNVQSGADLYIESNGRFEIKSGSKFVVSSTNFNIKENGNVEIEGKVVATSGKIAGLTVKTETNRSYMYIGTDSMTSTSDGVYIGTDGVNIGGYLKVSSDGASATFGSTKLSMDAKNGKVDLSGGNINVTADSSINITSEKHLTVASSGDIIIGNSGNPFTIGSNGTKAYMYNGPSSIGAATDGAYYGTDGLYIRGTSNNVTNYIKATSDGVVEISGKIISTTGTIGGWTVGSDYIGNAGTKNGSTVGLAYISSGTAITFWAGGAYNGTGNNQPKFWVKNDGSFRAVSATITGTISGSTITGGSINISNGTFKVGTDGKLEATGAKISGEITASSGTIADWNINKSLTVNGTALTTGLLWSGSASASRVVLDGSTRTYPLSGLASNASTKAMYAMWVGNDNPQDAPFSVTKDGIVTIKSLRIKKANNTYDTVDLNNFVYTDTSDADWSYLFGKLQFQTVKSVRQNSSTGVVTINVTNNSGGTGSYTFNTATSVKLGDGSWSSMTSSSARAYYSPTVFYSYNGTDINVYKDDVKPAYVTYDFDNANIFLYGKYENVPQGSVTLATFTVTKNDPSWSDAYVKTYKINIKRSGTDYETELLSFDVDASRIYGDGWSEGAKATTLDGSSASDGDVVNKTLSYDEKWAIKGYYYPRNSSIKTWNGQTYIVQAPGATTVTVTGSWEKASEQSAVYNKFIVKKNGSETLSTTVSTAITYNSSTHKYTAKTTASGTSNTVYSTTSGTEAYTAGASVSFTAGSSSSMSQFTAKATSDGGGSASKTYYLVKSGSYVEVHEGSQTGTRVARISIS